MKNKVELKNAIILSIITFIIINIIFLCLNYIEYKSYTEVFNLKIGNIVQIVKKNYPETDMNQIVELLNDDKSDKVNILKDYGIDLVEDSVIIENDKHFKIYFILEVGSFCILFLSLIFIFLN